MAIISMRIRALRNLLAAAIIRGRHLFYSELPIVRLLFEGGVSVSSIHQPSLRLPLFTS